MKRDISWFTDEFIPQLRNGYKIEYLKFKDGDFGDLERIEIEGNNKAGVVDFWSLGWLNIHFIDYQTGNEVLNILLEPHQEDEMDKSFKKLKDLL